jgi:hypothetical protein
LCGAIRYEYAEKPLGVIYCHCKDCQRCTGSPFATVVLIRTEALKVTQGKPGSFTVVGEEGRMVFREFCASCGSPLFSGLSESRKLMAIKAGSLDDNHELTPLMHIWTDSKVPWLEVKDELPRLPRNPPRPNKQPDASEALTKQEEKSHA